MVPPLLAFWALLVRNAFALAAFAIASPFARVSVFQLCASLGDQHGQLVRVISIYLAVNRRECTYASHACKQRKVQCLVSARTSQASSSRLKMAVYALNRPFTVVSRLFHGASCFPVPSCGLKMSLRPGRCVT